MRSSVMRLLGVATALLTALAVYGPGLCQETLVDETQTAESDIAVSDEAESHSAEPTGEEAAQLGKVTVTGSHIRRAQIEGPQPIEVVTPEMVREVGGVKLGDYIPYVPINQLETSMNKNVEGPAGDAFFNLRGLGYQATLTLVNGHRVASYGGHGASTFVNVNAIPLAAIERVEILKDGASAIYGADAIAGVVNVILKQDYEGVDLSASYSDTQAGGASESAIDLVAGRTYGSTNLTAILSWYDIQPLYNADRDITASADQRWRGGYDRRHLMSSPPNVYLLQDFVFTADPQCPPELLSFADFAGENLCRYDMAEGQIQVPGGERWAAQLFVSHEITPTLTLRGEVDYSDDSADRQFAPDWTNGSFVPAAHPDNPFDQDLLVFYRFTSGPNRHWAADTVGRRALLAAEGLAGAWAWRASAQWSDSTTDQRLTGLLDRDRLQAALVGEGGPSGDQWFNPFGQDPVNDPALVDWLADTDTYDSRTRLRTASLVADGPVFDISDGVVNLAVGAEFRDQAHWLHNDPRFFYPGFVDQENVASRQIRSLFAELSVPLPDEIELQLAGRYEDYSDFGGHFSPKVALAWRPTDSLLTRASYAESFRAPYFQDLYAPPTEDQAFVEDPVRCPVTGAAYDCGGGVALNLISGNPDLDPETGDSWYFGIVWSPERIAGLDLELDLWKFTFEDRVDWVCCDFVLENYPLDPSWVERADPTPEDQELGIPGRVETMYSRPINLGRIETQGVDAGLRYAWWAGNAGEFSGQLLVTYVDDFRVTDPTLSQWEYNGKNVAGKSEWGGAYGGMPRWKSVGSLSWTRGANSASAIVRFIDSYEDSSNWPSEDGSESDRPHRIGSWTTVDLQYSRTFRTLSGGRLSVGCNNCGDRDPPLRLGDQFGYDEVLHSVYGRQWYVSWSQRFAGVGK